MTLDHLIRNKRESIQPLAEIPTLMAAVEDQTIDLDDYGVVKLDDISSTKELTLDQVRDLVRELEPDLRDIFRLVF